MNKRALFTMFVLLTSLLYARDVTAQTPSATASASPTIKRDSTVESLKKRIESKVQELSKNSKQILSGYIQDITKDSLTLVTETDVEFKVSLDDTITQVKNSGIDESGELETSDLEKGQYILVTGPTIENQVTANKIFVQTEYLVIQGVITNVNKSSFSLDILTLDKDTYTIDVEDDTTQMLMDSKTLKASKTGFSKMRIGDTMHAVIAKPSTESKNARAHRILVLPQEYFEGIQN